MRFSSNDHSGYGCARVSKISTGAKPPFGPMYPTDDSPPEVYDGEGHHPADEGDPRR